MRESPSFPLLPVDRRVLAKLDRARFGTAPPAPTAVGQPFVPDPAADAARTLGRFFQSEGRPRPRPPAVAPRAARRRAVAERVPAALIAPACLLLAGGGLAAGLVVLLVCRPDLHPRLARRSLLSPREVHQVLAVHPSAVQAAVGLVQAFRRRVRFG